MARKGDGKRPKVGAGLSGSPQPKIGVPEPEPDGLLSWRLGRLDLHGRWGWRELDTAHIDDLHRVLGDAERTSILKLKQDGLLKDIPVRHFCREAKKRFDELGYIDHDVLYELRGMPKRRAWGFLEGRLFYVLWWDPNESVCHAPPKGERRR